MSLKFGAFRSAKSRSPPYEPVYKRQTINAYNSSAVGRRRDFQTRTKSKERVIFDGAFPQMFARFLVYQIKYKRMLLLAPAAIVFGD
jgi:hypothetical protein